MPIISFTASDALTTKVIDPGTYPCEVTKIDGPAKSKSGKSYSFYVDVTVTDGKYKGKTRTLVFNSETSSVSLLGEMQFFPQASLLELESAITGREILPEEHQLDTDILMNAPFDATWDVATSEGHLFNVINAFHPAGYGASAPNF